ncbi:patatin-like phospholipase family protein [Bacterioplanoides sp.]|uniref:patatin-like phospholipase family protein n=1 Tax=Bacterioplanoides sp. TaxID=2066072 RepID=UPI003B5CFA91
MANFPLKIFAGSEALAHIRQQGLTANDIEMVLGASGGPKWLSLAAIDRYLLSEWFADREKPLHVMGTSAGAWRTACYAQNDPLAAHARFQKAYVEQNYSDKPTAEEVAAGCVHILEQVLANNGAAQIINNPKVRYHTVVARCRGLAASDQKHIQSIGLAGAMLANLVSRGAMRGLIERTFFHHPEKPPIDHFPHLPAAHVALTEQNIKPALLATGAIPLVISGVKNIPGAARGTYRDGGVTDYQFDLPVYPERGFVLYPHYFARAPKGGWFDKKLRWRTASREHYKRTIIVAPSWEFAATLPGGQIPDLQDFYDFKYPERRQRWDTALQQCEALGEAFADLDQNNRWAEVAEPLPW